MFLKFQQVFYISDALQFSFVTFCTERLKPLPLMQQSRHWQRFESVRDAAQWHRCAAEEGPLVGAQRENITTLLLSIRLKIDAQF